MLPSSIVPRRPAGTLLVGLPIRIAVAFPALVAGPAAPAPLVQKRHDEDGAHKHELQPPWLRRRLVRERGAEQCGHRGGAAAAARVRRVGEKDEGTSGAEQRGRGTADDLQAMERQGGGGEGGAGAGESRCSQLEIAISLTSHTRCRTLNPRTLVQVHNAGN